jgi:hypothetical protein
MSIHLGAFNMSPRRKDARMSAGPESPNPATSGNEEGVERARQPRINRAKLGIIAAAIPAAAVIVAALITGVFGLLANSSSSSSSSNPPTPANSSAQECSGFRADVGIPPEVGSYAVLTIDFNCAPAAGQQYLWVVEAKDIGTNGHSEFYPKQFASGPHVGTPFNHTVDFTKDKIGQQNCFYIISVTNSEYDEIENNLSTNGYTLHLPEGVDQVSSPACETRVR